MDFARTLSRKKKWLNVILLFLGMMSTQSCAFFRPAPENQQAGNAFNSTAYSPSNPISLPVEIADNIRDIQSGKQPAPPLDYWRPAYTYSSPPPPTPSLQPVAIVPGSTTSTSNTNSSGATTPPAAPAAPSVQAPPTPPPGGAYFAAPYGGLPYGVPPYGGMAYGALPVCAPVQLAGNPCATTCAPSVVNGSCGNNKSSANDSLPIGNGRPALRGKNNRAPSSLVGQKRKYKNKVAGAKGNENYTVQHGDTLMKISYKKYGSLLRWRDILATNKSLVGSPNLLTPGMVLTIEGVEYVVIQKNGEPYLIRKNDTLVKISGQLYGTPAHWKTLWKNNEQLIEDPNKIYAGFSLYYQPLNKKSAVPANVEALPPAKGPAKASALSEAKAKDSVMPETARLPSSQTSKSSSGIGPDEGLADGSPTTATLTTPSGPPVQVPSVRESTWHPTETK